MAVVFTEEEIIEVAKWLRAQSMRDDLTFELREGLSNAQDAVQAMVYDLNTVRSGLRDVRAFNDTVRSWISRLLGEGQ